MNHYCVVAEVKPEYMEDYVAIHQHAWPEILDAISESGCENMRIFQYKNFSIVFYECEDIDVFYENYGSRDITKKWNQEVNIWFSESPNLKGTGMVV